MVSEELVVLFEVFGDGNNDGNDPLPPAGLVLAERRRKVMNFNCRIGSRGAFCGEYLVHRRVIE